MRIQGVLVLGAVLVAACGSPAGGDVDGGQGMAVDGGGGVGPDAAPTCVNLECKQVSCPGGGTTRLTGTVFSPAGTLPLYNITVYVPNADLAPIPDGVTCDRCGALSGSPLVMTTTDTQGRFVLENVPVGEGIPLVIVSGKWRRIVTLPTIEPCVDNALTDAGLTRLPRNKSEGSLPRIAISTGGADALECLVRKLGIDDAEFTTDLGEGRVHLYAGNGGTNKFSAGLGGADFTSSQSFWSSLANLERYDLVILSCEGNQNPNTKPPAAREALKAYTALGGRVFASHWHNVWVQMGPAPWPSTATFDFRSDLDDITADIDTTFPTGMALATWLTNVVPGSTFGQIAISAAQHTVRAVDPALTTRWIYKDVTANGVPSVQYFSFNTPVEAPPEQQCGKFVLTDIHVSSGDDSAGNKPFPTGCTTTELTPQEKVLAFMLFEITGCLEPGID